MEQLFREIIVCNPDSEIVCLPNTIFYEESEFGREALNASIEIYNYHPHLKIYAREMTSYKFMQPIYHDVSLVPDMVMYLNECKKSVDRHGCLLCLRSDIEKTLSDKEHEVIDQQVRVLFGDNVVRTDMAIGHGVSVEQRDEVLEEKFDQFRQTKLVITDRLHGMIFAAITGTPCIVLNSKSPKVLGCYEWIKNLEYIQFAQSPELLSEIYERMPKVKNEYQNEHLMHYYDELGKYISGRTVKTDEQ